MARFDAVWNAEQKAAMARARLDDDLTAPEIKTKAAAGKLYGLPPFDPPIATIYHYGRRELRRRKKAAPLERKNGGTAAADLRARVLVLAEGMLHDAEIKLDRGKLSNSAFGSITATVLKVADHLEQKQDPPCNGDLKQDESGETKAEPDLLERLASTTVPTSTQGNGRRDTGKATKRSQPTQAET